MRKTRTTKYPIILQLLTQELQKHGHRRHHNLTIPMQPPAITLTYRNKLNHHTTRQATIIYHDTTIITIKSQTHTTKPATQQRHDTRDPTFNPQEHAQQIHNWLTKCSH